MFLKWLFHPVLDRLRVVESYLAVVLKQGARMSAQLDALKAAVANNNDVIASAVVLIQGLKAKLDDAIASGDPAALQALSDQLGAQDTSLADAVAQNTPAADPPSDPAPSDAPTA